MEGVPLISRDGGRLFWEDFEKKVLDKLTNEHWEVRYFKARAEEQKRQHEILWEAYKEDELHLLEPCSECKSFLVYKPERGKHWRCECENIICQEKFCEIPYCDECEEPYCFECMDYCQDCEIFICKDCFNLNHKECENSSSSSSVE